MHGPLLVLSLATDIHIERHSPLIAPILDREIESTLALGLQNSWPAADA